MTTLVRIPWLFLACMLAALVAGACDTAEYKTFSFEHRTKPNDQYVMEYVTHFTFEYPREYRRINTYAKADPIPPIGVTFARGGSFFSRKGMDTMLGVSVSSPVVPHQVPEAAVDELLSAPLGRDQPLERSSTLVDGLPGELVAFRTEGFGNLAPLPLVECRYIFFEAEGRLWSIGICADISKADQARLDFEHIVGTFRILP